MKYVLDHAERNSTKNDQNMFSSLFIAFLLPNMFPKKGQICSFSQHKVHTFQTLLTDRLRWVRPPHQPALPGEILVDLPSLVALHRRDPAMSEWRHCHRPGMVSHHLVNIYCLAAIITYATVRFYSDAVTSAMFQIDVYLAAYGFLAGLIVCPRNR